MVHACQVPFVFNGVITENSSFHIQIIVNGGSNDSYLT
jgi:hypothetical protein